MQLVDTHTHLYLEQFHEDRDEAVTRAVTGGITRLVLPNIDSSTIRPLNNLCEKYANTCFPLMGLHPTSVKENFADELKIITAELKNNTYYGIGETGIDLYWDKTHFKQQTEAFRIQVELALELNLPIVIHARESFNELFQILSDYKNNGLKGVFHAFTGTLEQAEFILSTFNFYFGIGGIVTFKNSGLDRVVEKIGPEKIILETDSPFLAPVPFRGKRNESSYLIYVAEKVADIFHTSVEKVSEIATQNSMQLFNLI